MKITIRKSRKRYPELQPNARVGRIRNEILAQNGFETFRYFPWVGLRDEKMFLRIGKR